MITGITCFVGLTLKVHAKPMDEEASKRIPVLQSILKNVRESGKLSDQDRLVIGTNLLCGDPVLVSLAACVVAESKGDEVQLCAKAEEVLQGAEAMPRAFIQIMLAKKKTEGESADDRAIAIEALLKAPNPFSRLEAAKELIKVEVKKSEDVLRALLLVEDPVIKGEAYRQLNKIGKASDIEPVPMVGERYELLMSIIEGK